MAEISYDSKSYHPFLEKVFYIYNFLCIIGLPFVWVFDGFNFKTAFKLGIVLCYSLYWLRNKNKDKVSITDIDFTMHEAKSDKNTTLNIRDIQKANLTGDFELFFYDNSDELAHFDLSNFDLYSLRNISYSLSKRVFMTIDSKLDKYNIELYKKISPSKESEKVQTRRRVVSNEKTEEKTIEKRQPNNNSGQHSGRHIEL